jgi:hypothetical protein
VQQGLLSTCCFSLTAANPPAQQQAHAGVGCLCTLFC